MQKFNRGGGNKFGGERRGGGDHRGGNRQFGGGGFERKDFGGKGGFGGGNSVMMHKAICSKCGQECEVPFRPTGDKPVFCSNCFKGKDHSETRNFSDRSFSQPKFEEKRMPSSDSRQLEAKLETIIIKLDEIVKALKTTPVTEKFLTKEVSKPEKTTRAVKAVKEAKKTSKKKK